MKKPWNRLIFAVIPVLFLGITGWMMVQSIRQLPIPNALGFFWLSLLLLMMARGFWAMLQLVVLALNLHRLRSSRDTEYLLPAPEEHNKSREQSLRQLEELHRAGILGNQEYRERKREIQNTL